MNVSGLTLNFQQLAFLQVNSHHVTYESEDEGIQIRNASDGCKTFQLEHESKFSVS